MSGRMSDQGLFVGHHRRRRSADVGGLLLASENRGSGHGWGGWEEDETTSGVQTSFAELLSDMYNKTLSAVNEHNVEFPPTALSRDRRSHLINSLDSWNFEPHKLPDEEVLSCTLILFEALYRIEGMQDELSVTLKDISSFLHHLRQIYRWENSYHNYEHALDVLQASQMYLRSAGMVPPLSILLEGDDRMWKPDRSPGGSALIACLGNLDLFAIYIAAIGHDVGHPGLTNGFMKNAQAPLSIVYDGQSPLEQLHSCLLLKVMREHGLGILLDRPESGVLFRKLLWDTVLATDMSVHARFMANFKSLVSGAQVSSSNHKVLVCQAIIKCADISNPSRPDTVSQYWAGALTEEWSSQALLEKHLELPPTVQPADGPLNVARAQVWFIKAFALPLLNLTSQGIPEMEMFAQQCATNLSTWEDRCAELEGDDKDAVKIEVSIRPPTSPRPPDDFANVFPLALPYSARLPQAEKASAWHSLHRSGYSSSSSITSFDLGKNAQDTEDPVLIPSPPTSPSESVGSSIVSPPSDWNSSSSNPRPPSSCESHHTNSKIHGTSNDGVADIRATFKAGVRKKKSFYRNSWNPVPKSTFWPVSSSHLAETQPAVALVVSTNSSNRQTPTVTTTAQAILVARPIALE